MDNKFLSLWLKTWGLVKKLVGDVDVKEKGDLQTQIDNLKEQTDNIKIPTIPSIGNGTITIKQNGVQKGSFTTNQSGNAEIELTDSNTTYGEATASANGLMSAADKAKLNGIASGANAYSHPATSGNKHIPSGGASGQILRWSGDGTAAWGSDNNTTYSNATQNASGLMSAADKAKLDGVAEKANNYTYTHPSSHAANMITQDSTHRFVSDNEKSTWNGKADGAHTHDDRYYTETEIDNLFKAMSGKIPSGLGNIITGQFMFNTDADKDTGARNVDFYHTDSTYKRSMCILTSLYITAATTGVNTGNSFMREVAIHMVLHNDYDTEWHDTLKTAIYSKGSTADNVNITNKHSWQYQCDRTSVSDGRMTLRFVSPDFAVCGAKFKGATAYVSWAIIM